MPEKVEGARRSTFGGGIWLAASQVIPLAGTAALSVVMGRLLGPAELGLQSYIAYVQALLFAVVVGSMGSAAIRTLSQAHGAGDPELFARVGRWAGLSMAVGGLLSGICLMALGISSGHPLPWFIVSITVLVDSIGWGFGVRSVSDTGWNAVAIKRLVTQTTAIVLGIGAVFIGFGVPGVFTANLIAAVGLTGWLMLSEKRLAGSDWLPFPTAALKAWMPLMMLTVLQQVVTARVEFLFLGAYSNDEQIAMYSVPFMVVSAATTGVTALIYSGLPKVAASFGAGTMRRTIAALGPAIRITTVSSLLLAGVVASAGPAAVRLLYGAAFAEAASLLPLMALALVSMPVGMICSTFWAGSDFVRVPLMAIGVASVIDIALCFTLIPEYGATGAAIANLLGQLAMGAILLSITWKTAGRFPLGGRRWACVLALCGGLALVASALVTAIGNESTGSSALALTAGLMVYVLPLCVVGWTVGFIDDSDSRWLYETLPPGLHQLARLLVGPGNAELSHQRESGRG